MRKEIRHELYLEANPEANADDRKRLIAQIPLYEAFLRDLGYTPEKASALLTKQRAEIIANNQHIIESQEKEDKVQIALRRKRNSDIFFASFDFEYLDENKVWMPCKNADHPIVYEHKNKSNEVDFVVKTTPREIVGVDLLDAIAELKSNDVKEIKEKMKHTYDNYELYQWYPTNSEHAHLFRIRMKWRI